MDALISAMEASLVHFNLWAYNPLNRNDIGDDWNGESFSWFSEDKRQKELASLTGAEAAVQTQNPDVGGSLLDVVVRPYAVATAGTPVFTQYLRSTGLFTHRWRSMPRKSATPDGASQPPVSAVTEIFLPARIYGSKSLAGLRWTASHGGFVYFDSHRQRLFVWFNDSDEVIAKGKEVARRIDVWVTEPVGDDNTYIWIGLLFILAVAGFVALNELHGHFTGQYWVDLPLLHLYDNK